MPKDTFKKDAGVSDASVSNAPGDTGAEENVLNVGVSDASVSDAAGIPAGNGTAGGVQDAALIEAVLFLETEPLDEAALVRISGLTKERAEAALEALRSRYDREESGLELSRIGGGIIISPKKEYWEILKERYGKKNEGRLSRAAMETLSIIAYSQPITRSEVEAIRGVQADTMIRLLLERELIRETGKKDIPGKPILFGTTKEFLKLFRLESIADLPKLDEREAERFEPEK